MHLEIFANQELFFLQISMEKQQFLEIFTC